MAWERRKRGGHYYTRSRRVGGRVVREYFGRGELAVLVERLDALDRETRATEREERQRERVAPTALQGAVRALGCELDAFVALELEARGYHHHRGEWRRRRIA